MRVALFITCFNDTLFPQTGRATVEVLERLGHEVEFPLAQTCCGQMHFNTGYQREAIPLVRRFVEVFSRYEAVVAPSGALHRLPGKLAGWTEARDVKPIPEQTLREWWKANRGAR